MAFIAFNYMIRGRSELFTGKYVTYHISDDHEGLDEVVKGYLVDNLNKWRQARTQETLKKCRPLRRKDVKVGVIGFSDGYGRAPSYSYSAKNEAEVFDFYYDESNEYKPPKIFVNGKLFVEESKP